MMHAAKPVQAVLDDIASGEFRMRGGGIGFEDYKGLVRFPLWSSVEDRYRAS